MTKTSLNIALAAVDSLRSVGSARGSLISGSKHFEAHFATVGSLGSTGLQDIRRALMRNPVVRFNVSFQVILSLLLWGVSTAVLYALAVSGTVSADREDALFALSLLGGLLFGGLAVNLTWLIAGEGVDRRSDLLERLAPAATEKDRCVEAFELVEAYGPVSRFRAAVLASGRELTLLDLDLMLAWGMAKVQEELEQERDEACKKLLGQA